jgi:uncharacterized 2Fe-2S/4Fe-4S cluster protein (DUF4445 family)
MRDAEIPVIFQPRGETVYVLKGTRLPEAAAGAGIVLDLPCGGEGVCKKCRVQVPNGDGEPTAAEQEAFSSDELRAGFRLACQSAVSGPMTVVVPQTSLLAAQNQILAQSSETIRSANDPAIRKCYVELTPPSRGDDDPDLVRLEKAIGPFSIDLPLLRDIGAKLRESDFQGTAVLADHHLIDFEPQNTVTEAFAVATDVGTTTLVSVLLDLHTGQELAVASRLNPQTRFGDDVLSRILYAERDGGLQSLHQAVVGAIDEMVGQLCDEAKVSRQRIYELSFSGNTAMQHLLCRVDPSPLGKVPFVATAGRGLWLSAAELGLDVHPRAMAYILPVIGGFVGGDTVSGILATGLSDLAGPTLFVDIGTNGEIVLWANGKLTAASTAAGPAFEGARISRGMRGSVGAIEKVVFDGHLHLNVIGNVAPVGLCGSALIDIAAELLRHGLLTPEGRLQAPDQLPSTVPGELAAQIVADNGRVAFLLAPAAETGDGKPIALTQRDLRELQLASGAIRAGTTILLEHAGLRAADLDAVLMGGGFGNFIRRSNAQRIGLLPPEIEHRRIRYRGNTSLAGARLVTLSQQARQMAEELAERTQHVDLSAHPGFSTMFADAMIFPSA